MSYIADTVDNESTFERIFLHEYIHAITSKSIIEDPNNPALSSLRGLISHIKTHVKNLTGKDVDSILESIKAKGSIQDKEDEIYLGLINEHE